MNNTMTRHRPSETTVEHGGWLYQLQSYYRDDSPGRSYGYLLRPALRIQVHIPGLTWSSGYIGTIDHPDAIPLDDGGGYALWSAMSPEAWAMAHLDATVCQLIDAGPIMADLPAHHPHHQRQRDAIARWNAEYEGEVRHDSR